MAIELRHPATGNTITVDDERAAAVHAESGWVRVVAAGSSAEPPARPADDAPPRKWLAYAAALGLAIVEDQIGSAEELIEAIDAQLAATAPDGDEPPDRAEDLIAWIGQDPDRATAALEAENERTSPRKTVTEHIESVLNATTITEET